MTANAFVQSIKTVVQDGAARDLIQGLIKPPGRRPDPELVSLGEWYGNLTEKERELINAIIRLATRQAAYNTLLILDGLAQIEAAGPKGKLRLYYEKNAATVLLNDPDSEELTVLF